MDAWAWEHLEPWRQHRLTMPVGPLLCVVEGATRGRAWSATGARTEPRRLAAVAGVRRRFAPHQLRHAHAVEMAREGIPLPVIQRQLGHAHLGVTSTYLQGIDTSEIIHTIHSRQPPTMPASAGLRLDRGVDIECVIELEVDELPALKRLFAHVRRYASGSWLARMSIASGCSLTTQSAICRTRSRTRSVGRIRSSP